MAKAEEALRSLRKASQDLEINMATCEGCRSSHSGKYEICELFSPPRVTKRAQQKDGVVRGGWSVDCEFIDPITNRKYDLLNKNDQKEILKMIHRDKPLFIILSPPCTLWSIARTTGETTPAMMNKARELIRFILEV